MINNTTQHQYEEGDEIEFSFNQLIRATKTARITLTQEEAKEVNEADDKQEALLELVQSKTEADLASIQVTDTDHDEPDNDDLDNFEITEILATN